jgi:membrane protease YdiL (CAAX protease family)
VDRSRPGRDVAAGAGIAAIIGGAGLGLYLLAHAIGVNRAVVPAELPAAWWRIPVEIIVAAQNGILEEILVLGYLLHRLDQLGWSRNRAVAASAVLRGSYHLYQGLGGFAGNVIMGVIFAKLYQRFGRVGPLIVAHTLIDSVALVGYTLLVGHVSWLPHGG